MKIQNTIQNTSTKNTNVLPVQAATSANQLPILSIAEPCPMSWDSMQGCNTTRFCTDCSKHVFNFSEMPRDQVQSLLHSGESVCAQIRRLPDGSVMTREDQTQATRRIWWRRWRLRMGYTAASLLSLVSFGGCNEQTVQRFFPWLGEEHAEPVTGIVDIAEIGDVVVAPEPIRGKVSVEMGAVAIPSQQPVEIAAPGEAPMEAAE
jgi:hypothetical protein